MRNQLKFLKQYEAEIINKLRTECINLNGYKKYRFGETSGKCYYCDVEEWMNELNLTEPTVHLTLLLVRTVLPRQIPCVTLYDIIQRPQEKDSKNTR